MPGVGSGLAAAATCRRGVTDSRTATGADTDWDASNRWISDCADRRVRGAIRDAKRGQTGWLGAVECEPQWLKSLVVGLVALVEVPRNA